MEKFLAVCAAFLPIVALTVAFALLALPVKR